MHRAQFSIDKKVTQVEFCVQFWSLFHNKDCRAMKEKVMACGWWSLVNCWREGSYKALYNMLMNINQMAICLTAGRSHGSALRVIGGSNVIPRQGPPSLIKFYSIDKNTNNTHYRRGEVSHQKFLI